ncbi:MAG: hypothetical protein ACI8QS_000777 [Planctomycetota bacterium]|jgi:hypothetical protein
MPFHFGAVKMVDMELLAVRVEIEIDGKVVHGHTESVLSPLWFDKSSDRTPIQKRDALLHGVRRAGEATIAAGSGTLLELHRDSEGDERPLVSSFGIAMIDAAMVDALCRATGRTLHALLGRPAPANHMSIRHTVGLADPLVAGDLKERLNDDLPETLEEAVRQYGLRYFKVKVGADVEHTAERLRRISEVLRREAPGYKLSLDGNETQTDTEAFGAWATQLSGDPALADIWSRILWIEQPLARHAALEGPLPKIDKPVIIDESDGYDNAVVRALELGYSGTSSKTCKGLFRSLHSIAALEEHGSGILAGEDLTTVPMLALQHDLAVAGALGITHLERNGHHYVRGLGFLTEGEQALAMEHFPSLYHRLTDGTPALHIRDGTVDTTEVNAHAFGAPFGPEWDAYDAVDLPGEISAGSTLA